VGDDMSAPRTLAEAQAQCRALGVDLRVSGRGMSACMDLLSPFCPNGVTSTSGDELPSCLGAPPSARKAAVLLAEAQARANAAAGDGPPWLLLGVGVLALGGLAYWLAKK
jgi:hypothetical protein